MTNSRDFLVGDTGFNEKINNLQKNDLEMLKHKYYLDRLNNEDKDTDESNLLNLSMTKIYNNMTNIIPNLYNDYYKEYLDISISGHKNENENSKIRGSLINTFFKSENIIYVGMWFIIIALLLYILDI